MKQPKRLPSAKEYARLGWHARVEVLATLQSIKLAYLNTEETAPSSSRQPVVYAYTGDRLPVDIQN